MLYVFKNLLHLLLQLRQYLNSVTCGFYDVTNTKVCCDDDFVAKPQVVPKSVEETTVCGIRNGVSNALISGGEDAMPGDWPWMVLLDYSNKNL